MPFARLVPGEDRQAVETAIARVIDRGWFVLGPEVEAFESEFAAACGVSASVGVGNGTDAIAIILRALGIGPGDEVVTTPVSAAYTALADSRLRGLIISGDFIAPHWGNKSSKFNLGGEYTYQNTF
ncbi:MAG: hypothetical protein EHM24_24375, partial [Acidobacteria bacterium]